MYKLKYILNLEKIKLYNENIYSIRFIKDMFTNTLLYFHSDSNLHLYINPKITGTAAIIILNMLTPPDSPVRIYSS